MSDVLKTIDTMVARFVKEYGDVHKQETTQHERHLTWVTSHYAKELNLLPSDSSDGNEPYFGQAYNNLTFKVGYRIGLKEGFQSGKGDIEELEADLRKTALDYLAAEWQAEEAYQAQLAAEARIEELEAKLAEALEMALDECGYLWRSESYNNWWQERHNRVAELKGAK